MHFTVVRIKNLTSFLVEHIDNEVCISKVIYDSFEGLVGLLSVGCAGAGLGALPHLEVEVELLAARRVQKLAGILTEPVFEKKMRTNKYSLETKNFSTQLANTSLRALVYWIEWPLEDQGLTPATSKYFSSLKYKEAEKIELEVINGTM